MTASNLWVAGPTLFRGSYQDEASWVKLPDDSILTIDPFGTNSERYIPSLNRWINDANVPVSLYDPFGFELGAAFLLPDWRKALTNPKLVPSFGGYFGEEAGRPLFVFAKGAWNAGVAGLAEKQADAQARLLAAELP